MTTGKKKKKEQVEWTSECNEAFSELKSLCISAPILAYADFSKPFKLHTDASQTGLGAVLYQEQDGLDRVIAYASRSLTTAEKKYPAHKLEFLALKWAVTDKFHEYLYGNSFQVFTDNNPLTYILGKAKLDAAGYRWVAALANYNFCIFYRPGKTNTDADTLSRIQVPECFTEKALSDLSLLDHESVRAVCNSVIHSSPSIVEAYSHSDEAIHSLATDIQVGKMNNLDWAKEQRQDPITGFIVKHMLLKSLGRYKIKSDDPPALKALIKQSPNLRLREGVLYRKIIDPTLETCNFQLVLPSNFQTKALLGCHDDVGHPGKKRTLDLLRDRFYWPGMSDSVDKHLSKCQRCRAFKAKPDHAPLASYHASHPFELIHIDFLCLEPSKGQEENVLVITDHFTRYAQAYVTKTQTAATTAKKLWENFITHYGFPSKIISDQGRNFESDLIKDLCNLAGVEKIRTSPYHPQTNGQCEKFNSTLINMLGTLEPEQKTNWKAYVPALVHAYNCTKNFATGFSPYYLLFGRNPRLPIDVEFGLGISNLVGKTSRSKYVEQLKRRMAFAHQKADQQSRKEKARFKKLYDRKTKGLSLHPDDLVLVKVTAFKGRHKIQDRWEPTEYKVVAQPHPNVPVYKVEPTEGGKSRVLHRNFLLPIETTLEGPAEKEPEDEEPVLPEVQVKTPVQTQQKRPTPEPSFSLTDSIEPSTDNPTTDNPTLSHVSDTTYESSVQNSTEQNVTDSAEGQSGEDTVDTADSSNSGNVENDASKVPIVESSSDDDDDSPALPFLRRSSRRTKGFIPDRYGAYVSHSLYAHPPDL